jgi:hypothetical protein
MKTRGMPESFWVVTMPTPYSTIGDICFCCDLRQFAQQIRGGLDEDTIVATFAEEADARAEAERLVALFRNEID